VYFAVRDLQAYFEPGSATHTPRRHRDTSAPWLCNCQETGLRYAASIEHSRQGVFPTANAPGTLGSWTGGHYMDRVNAATRSRMMSSIRGRDTGPERAVRSLAHRLGFRFRLQARHLPGTPDLIFPKLKTALFVHGCYWHRHAGCRYCYEPKSNVEFWRRKFEGNVRRDAAAESELLGMGWRPVVVWECEIRDQEALADRLKVILDSREAA
jgi:DNA mismatch endonuclease, patch repair protein